MGVSRARRYWSALTIAPVCRKLQTMDLQSRRRRTIPSFCCTYRAEPGIVQLAYLLSYVEEEPDVAARR